jgi:8-oxo-dGTP diphosphatase
VKLPRHLRGVAYQVFYGLPLPVRRQVARLVSPKFLVGAVTIIRDSQATAPGRLLLLRQPPGRGWGLPAGLLKHRELPAVGAARELFEEAGVRLEPGDLIPGNPNAIIHPQGGVVDTVWFGSVPADSTTLAVDGGEVLEARWFPVDDLPELTWPTARLLGIYGIGPRSGLLPPSIPADPYRTPATLPSAAPAAVDAQADPGTGLSTGSGSGSRSGSGSGSEERGQ